MNEAGVCRLRGYAWGENIGWINLDDAGSFVAAPGTCDDCEIAGDVEPDGDVDIADLAILLAHFGASGQTSATGDTDGDGDVDLSDLSTLLSNFGATCP